jgi:hypothetical protein
MRIDDGQTDTEKRKEKREKKNRFLSVQSNNISWGERVRGGGGTGYEISL